MPKKGKPCPPTKYVPPVVLSEEHDRRVGAAVRRLFEQDLGGTISLFGLRDQDNGLFLVGGTSHVNGKRQHCSEDTVVDAVEKLAGCRKAKACNVCGTRKFLNQFHRDAKNADARRHTCKECLKNEALVRKTLARGGRRRPAVTARGS
jgi:hypothetical protein